MTTTIHSGTSGEDFYRLGDDGLYRPIAAVSHRDEEYDSHTFAILSRMQENHFWYRGRHRFLLRALKMLFNAHADGSGVRSGIDLGGGCGGWVKYLQERDPAIFTELALADSSLDALRMAQPLVGQPVKLYQIDLMNLGWQDRWDVAFLLDVLEHIPDDSAALRQVWQALKPGGLLFVTTPALQFFWSHNDEMAHHVRRYSRRDFAKLAGETGFEMRMSRYFMFFLSPLLMASRLKKIDMNSMTRRQVNEHMAHTHRVPSPLVNGPLAAVFGAETPIGHWIPFPWGTSVLGVFRKPG